MKITIQKNRKIKIHVECLDKAKKQNTQDDFFLSFVNFSANSKIRII